MVALLCLSYLHSRQTSARTELVVRLLLAIVDSGLDISGPIHSHHEIPASLAAPPLPNHSPC